MGDLSKEPSMEEILSSIKRIIAEDGEIPSRRETKTASRREADRESHRKAVVASLAKEADEGLVASSYVEEVLELTEEMPRVGKTASAEDTEIEEQAHYALDDLVDDTEIDLGEAFEMAEATEPAPAPPTRLSTRAIEAKWYAHWEAERPVPPGTPRCVPYTIVNPPPNVTGSLHIGHALDNTLQDVVIRYERLRGKDALWVVGTDHAGIATQMVVERQLEAQKDKRTNYTREAFIDKVWEWKAEAAAPSPASCAGSAVRWTGRANSSPWTRTSPSAVVKVFVDSTTRA
jgi:hypothetical protein